jgi:hypothetical protein
MVAVEKGTFYSGEKGTRKIGVDIVKGRKKFRFKSRLYSLDASLIDLCLSLFDWATYRKTKGAVKLHLLLDHEGYLPVFANITEGSVHEINIARKITFAPGSIVAIDRGYTDYGMFSRWTDDGVYFVTRQKANAVFTVVEERPVPRHRNILKDQLIEYDGFYSRKKCSGILRKIEVWDDEKRRLSYFLPTTLPSGSLPYLPYTKTDGRSRHSSRRSNRTSG